MATRLLEQSAKDRVGECDSVRLPRPCFTRDDEFYILDCARACNLTKLKYLMSAPYNINDIVDEHGWTALHYAVWGGSMEMVQYIVEELKGDVLSTTDYGWTPMHCACMRGNTSIVQYLYPLSRATEPVCDYRGMTPMDYAGSTLRALFVED